MTPKLPTPKVTEKPLPVEYRHQLKVDWHSNFSFWERCLIFIGAGVWIKMSILTRHDPGPWQPIINSRVSKEATPDAHHQAYIESLLTTKKESPVKHEPSQRN